MSVWNILQSCKSELLDLQKEIERLHLSTESNGLSVYQCLEAKLDILIEQLDTLTQCTPEEKALRKRYIQQAQSMLDEIDFYLFDQSKHCTHQI